MAGGGHRQWNLVFVIVVLHVGAEAHKHRHVAVLQITEVVDKGLVVDEHLQALVGAQVEACVAIHAAGVAGLQALHLHLHRLLVELRDLRLARVDDAAHARRQHVVHRLAARVLLDVHRVDVDGAVGRSVAAQVQVIVVVAPLAAHQLEGGEAQVGGLLEAGHEHAHEANGGEVVDRAHLFLIVAQGNVELIPRDLLLLAVAGGHLGGLLVDYVVFAHLEVGRANRHAILEIALILVERVVLVDVFHIGHAARRLVEAVCGVVGRERVAVGAVVVLVAVEDRHLLLVEVIAAVKVVAVARGVVEGRELVLLHGLDRGRGQHLAQPLQEVGIGGIGLLVFGAEAIETHVLLHARAGGVVEGIGERRLGRHPTPHGVFDVGGVAVHGQAVFIRLEAVLEDVLAHLAQVEVKVAAVLVVEVGVEEGIHHPKLHILDVRLLEVGVVEAAHDAAPALLGVEQVAVGVNVGRVEVIGAALLGIEREVERLNGRRLAVVEFAAREHLAVGNFAHVGVRQLVEVVFQIAGNV